MTEIPAFDAGEIAKLKAELVRDEGLRLKVYRCTAGKRTIGVGRNLDDVGILPEETRALGLTAEGAVRAGVTRAQAMALLDFDVARCVRQLDAKLPWWRGLNPVRRRVLANMMFNLGPTRLLGFRNTLAFIRAGDWARAANGMERSLWRRQVGDRAVRLVEMMATGRELAA